MTGATTIVSSFLTLLEQHRAGEAIALLSPDVEWHNTSMPTFRGPRVAGMLRDMERRGVGFRVDLHAIAADGDVVLTDRTDHLSYGRWTSSFWVCGTFVIDEGRIRVWNDRFSPGNVLVASVRGLGGLLRS